MNGASRRHSILFMFVAVLCIGAFVSVLAGNGFRTKGGLEGGTRRIRHPHAYAELAALEGRVHASVPSHGQ